MKLDSNDKHSDFVGWGRRVPKTQSGSVLFALTDGEHPTLALQQCTALARSLEAEVHVLRVLRPERGSALTAPDVDLVQAERGVERSLLEACETKAWWNEVLPEPLLTQRLLVGFGDFIKVVACRAAEVDAAFIVLAPSMDRLGETARTLAHASSCPVLVARTWLPEATVIAATHLEDENYSVLRQAADLGVRLGGAVAVHNVACLPMAFNFELRAPAAVAASAGTLGQGGSRLVNPADRLERHIGTEVDAVNAILEQARAQDADLIVVGTRPNDSYRLSTKRSMAEEVVNRSDRSVLVTPIFRAEGGPRRVTVGHGGPA